MSTRSDIAAACVFCSGPVGERDLHAVKHLCNLCAELIAHSWCRFISTCLLCGEELSDTCVEGDDVVLREESGGESVAASEGAVH